jgi:hypothetical protein
VLRSDGAGAVAPDTSGATVAAVGVAAGAVVTRIRILRDLIRGGRVPPAPKDRGGGWLRGEVRRTVDRWDDLLRGWLESGTATDGTGQLGMWSPIQGQDP